MAGAHDDKWASEKVARDSSTILDVDRGDVLVAQCEADGVEPMDGGEALFVRHAVGETCVFAGPEFGKRYAQGFACRFVADAFGGVCAIQKYSNLIIANYELPNVEA